MKGRQKGKFQSLCLDVDKNVVYLRAKHTKLPVQWGMSTNARCASRNHDTFLSFHLITICLAKYLNFHRIL